MHSITSDKTSNCSGTVTPVPTRVGSTFSDDVPMETDSLKTPEICGIKDLLPVFEDSQDLVELQFNSNDSEHARSESREDREDEDDGGFEGEVDTQFSDPKDAERRPRGKYLLPPSLEDVQSAHTDLKKILHPKRPNGIGYKNPEINLTLASRFQAMQLFMWRFINPDS